MGRAGNASPNGDIYDAIGALRFQNHWLAASVAIFMSGLPCLGAICSVGGRPGPREEIQRGVIDEALKGQAQPLSVDETVERSACPLAGPELFRCPVHASSRLKFLPG